MKLSTLLFLQPCLAAQVILGPVFDQPTGLPSNPLVQDAVSIVIQTLRDAFRCGKTTFNESIDNGTALSLTVASAEGTLLDFHHTPAEFNKSAASVTKVDADTVYRIGSISKLFTAYTFLLSGGRKHWDTPVGKVVPELNGTRWKDITLGALASQLGGVGRSYADGLLDGFPVEQIGLPELPPDQVPKCGGTKRPCSRQEFLKGFAERDFISLPYTTAEYSNAGYHILGYAIEALTNQTFPSALDSKVFKPLDLYHTSVLNPPSGGFIPNGPAQWDVDLGDGAAEGGLYSSTRDLSKLGLDILQEKQLSSLETRRWLKPHSHTASLRFSVGAPWEIWRVEIHGRVIELYAKGGDIGMYTGRIMLIPEYGLVISVLAAGKTLAVANTASEAATEALLPVLDDVARQQACDKYCGRYENGNSSLVLNVTDGQPGLLMAEWTSRGKDVMEGIRLVAGQLSGANVSSVRLYPMNTGTYRALLEMQMPGDAGTEKRLFSDPAALQWSLVDAVSYGGVGFDEFALDGKTATPLVMRQTLHRLS